MILEAGKMIGAGAATVGLAGAGAGIGYSILVLILLVYLVTLHYKESYLKFVFLVLL